MAARIVQAVAAVTAQRWRRSNAPSGTGTPTTDAAALYDGDAGHSRHYDYGATNESADRRRSASRDPLLTIEEDRESICSSLQDKDFPPRTSPSYCVNESLISDCRNV